jgi:response regulator of citrate/malate metabolism
LKLLFIDDEPSFNELASEASRHYGVEFKTATNFKEAQELLKTYEPTHIFVDIFMPGGNGVDFVKANQDYDGKFYLMTADFEREGAADKLNNDVIFFSGTIVKSRFINGLRAVVMSEQRLYK